MIPLGAGDIPSSGVELAERVSAAVGALIQTSGSAMPKLQCEMASAEQIQQLSLDLTGVESAATRAEKPGAFTRLGDVMVNALSVGGDPLVVHGAPVVLNISVRDLPMVWSRDDRGNLWLAPADERGAKGNASGKMEFSAAVAQIEQTARKVISEVAEANGARLKDLRLQVESAGPRSLLLGADVAAAKFMMTAKVRAIAELSLDDEMNLHVKNLDVTGDGAAGAMVANMISGKLGEWRGREISLSQYMFAGAVLEDVHFEVSDRVRLTAKFGSGD